MFVILLLVGTYFLCYSAPSGHDAVFHHNTFDLDKNILRTFVFEIINTKCSHIRSMNGPENSLK